jgi:predicted helicase
VYYDRVIVHRTYQQTNIFPIGIKVENLAIGISGSSHAKPFQTLVVSMVPCLDLLEKTQFLPLFVHGKDGTCHDNITDWALKQFTEHYQNLTKRDIFNYVYAILHDPRYRQKFALNLKQEFPRIPFHPDFHPWADIGAQLIELHAHFENVTPFELQRLEIRTETSLKVRLKADKTKNRIEIDTNTHLTDISPQAWQYQLGNRSALEWILDQYKEKTPKDRTIREKFNTYRFANYKESVIDRINRKNLSRQRRNDGSD